VSVLREQVRAFASAAEDALEAAQDETSAARLALEMLAGADLLKHAVSAPGGDPVPVSALCDVRYELARSSGMLDIMFAMQGLGTCPLALAGSLDQCEDVLPGVLAGKDVAAFALTEPEAGSDLSGVSTRAAATSEGWVLNGHKTFISNAPLADVYTVLARTAGEPRDKEGLSMFVVRGDAPGIRVEGFEVMAPHPIGDVYFSDVELGAGALVGEEGAGMALALGTLGHFRTSVAAAACGMARRALDESLNHLRSRQQFGRPLSSFQGLRMDLAEMDTRLRAAELLVAEAAEAVGRGEAAVREVARAKLFATEAAGWICDRSVQHLGGLGVKRGQIVERLYREVRALRIYEGTSEVQKLILAKAALENANL
jgi:acyl-CoA dehydrogenase